MLFHACNCSLAASNLPVTSADKISAAQIQQYFEEASGKKDWSKRAWAEWCTMEKGLHQESMDILCEVSSKPWSLFLIVLSVVYLSVQRDLLDLLHVQAFKSSRAFSFRRGCLLAMVSVSVNEVCPTSNKIFHKFA